MKHLRSVLKDSIKKYFQQWQNCWRKCIALEGENFEVDQEFVSVSNTDYILLS